MNRIHYKDRNKLKKAYYAAFSAKLSEIESQWEVLKRTEPLFANFKFNAVDIMLGNLDMLIRVYLVFEKNFNIWAVGKAREQKKQMKDKIKAVFDYTKYHDIIASFFMDYKDDIDLHICYYCETAYINVYQYSRTKRNHFDLDHVLDKGSCPILGLSLFNFVPSCQCCNEKIKKQQIFGYGDKNKMYKLSPTSDAFDFDGNVKIDVAIKSFPPCKGYVKNAKCYGIAFKTKDADYNDYIDKLHLRERYDYHSVEALRLLDLAESYTPTTIAKISALLGYEEKRVKEDIFGIDFTETNHRCFGKLRRDILIDMTV